ncbi:MAG TPA: 6-phosphofructokinase [Desulfobacteraceae bacterium]|nr:6-phosphofructokinase [Desulfobacteraceae bacterium]
MKTNKLYIALVGLPARGKSTIANRLKDNLRKDNIRVRIFNNGDLRRRLTDPSSSNPEFYAPRNTEGTALREHIAMINIARAKNYLARNGQVAVIDATHASKKRRDKLSRLLDDHPVLFIECINEDETILEASVLRKITLPEFNHLSREAAIESFNKRIAYYQTIYSPLNDERNFVILNSLHNKILKEEISDTIPFYDRTRDFLVTDTVKTLFLVRHGETYFNLENRIGGDSGLTENGWGQADAIAGYFGKVKIPFIFTSTKKRTKQTAIPVQAEQKGCETISLKEFDEIDSGICECMSYEEIREKFPEIYAARKKDKYNYLYPEGEGYTTMRDRIYTGIKKALYLSGTADRIMIIGHRGVNRMILAHFLYRRQEDVPYIYVPQDKYYHIVATQDKKLLQLKPFMQIR